MLPKYSSCFKKKKVQKDTVSHQQATQLLHNKYVVVVGDSIQRSVYKDLVLLLQMDRYLSASQLRSKGEMSFEQDRLVEGGCLNVMTNGTEYKEVREFRSDHHMVRFYFVTRVFSWYMQSIMEDFRRGLKPDVIIINSCVWDISRYNSAWIDNYKENLHKLFKELKELLPEESLVIWNLTMPLAERIKGGFLVPEVQHKAPQLRYDVIEANFFSGTLADSYDMDVLDLHYRFRFALHHRTKDGVHWNAIAHRRITALLLQHMAQAWGVILDCPQATEGEEESTGSHTGSGDIFLDDSLPHGYLSFEDKEAQVQPQPVPPPRRRRRKQKVSRNCKRASADSPSSVFERV
uniref:Family with sequence similarity 113 n=1 Tax=Nothobranchius furzeri TaxID=105023 RepID=A0A8C6KCS9_NOTFU